MRQQDAKDCIKGEALAGKGEQLPAFAMAVAARALQQAREDCTTVEENVARQLSDLASR